MRTLVALLVARRELAGLRTRQRRSDLDNLNEGDRQALAFELFSWVESGPPRETRRDVLGVEMFDDNTPSGFRVTYVVDEDNERVLVVRIRNPPEGG